jgi:hypothetical protein
MKKSSLRMSLLGIAALMLPLALFAQDEAEEAPGPLSDVWMIVVKPGMDAEFNAAMGAHMQFRADAGEANGWDAFRVAVGHDIRPIQMRSCCYEWADLDAQEAEDTELGLSAHFNENVGQFVDHYHHYLERADYENSHWPDGSDGPYYGVTTWIEKQGAGPASGKAMEKMSQLALNDGWATEDNSWLWLSRIGGKDALLIASSFKDYADMAPPEQTFFEYAAEHMGEDEAGEMFKDFSKGFSDSDYTIWRHDESLSTPGDDE